MKILQFRELILFRAYADLRRESERTYLGVAWWVLDPILNMIVFYVVFSTILKRGVEDFIPFLLIGLVTWNWFESTVNQGCSALVSNKGLILQTEVTKTVFPLSVVIVHTFKFSVSFLVLLVFLWIYGFSPEQHYVFLPAIMLVQLVLVLALALCLSALVSFVPDLLALAPYGLRMMFFLSGIFYRLDTMAPKLSTYAQFNPMHVLITSYRDVLMYGQWPAPQALIIWAFLSLTACVMGFALHSKLDPQYAKRMVK